MKKNPGPTACCDKMLHVLICFAPSKQGIRNDSSKCISCASKSCDHYAGSLASTIRGRGAMYTTTVDCSTESVVNSSFFKNMLGATREDHNLIWRNPDPEE